jgi:hypothetical protein
MNSEAIARQHTSLNSSNEARRKAKPSISQRAVATLPSRSWMQEVCDQILRETAERSRYSPNWYEEHRNRRRARLRTNQRLAEVRKWFLSHYTPEAVHIPECRAVLFEMLRHLCRVATTTYCKNWLDQQAPGLGDAARRALFEQAADRDLPLPTADELAVTLGITYAHRQEWGFITIGACDVSREHRERRTRKDRRQRDRAQKAEARRNAGRPTRGEWLAENSADRDQPWVPLGISERTWYRRRQKTQPRILPPVGKWHWLFATSPKGVYFRHTSATERAFGLY